MPGPRYPELLAHLGAARAAGVSLGLDRVRTVLDRIGNPEHRFVSVQIAGTNGKGSTAAMTESILRAAGVRTGLFTSPHLSRFTERIRIDGREVDGDRLALLHEAIRATGIPLTYFEIATVLGFRAFADGGVEAAVLETGLGGRLDATTTCRPAATAITGIGFDHTELLGAGLAEIAREKAGIAKRGVPLLLAPLPREAETEIVRIAAAVDAPLIRIDVGARPPPPVALRGAHQATNAALAVALAGETARALGRSLPAGSVERGLSDVVWPGRLEWIGDGVLLDSAHNLDGAGALATALDGLDRRPRILLASVVEGKAAAEILAVLAPRFDTIVATRSSNERAMSAAVLGALAPPGTRTLARESPAEGLALATSLARPDGVVVVTGSIFLVGDLRAALLGETRDPLPTSDPISVPKA